MYNRVFSAFTDRKWTCQYISTVSSIHKSGPSGLTDDFTSLKIFFCSRILNLSNRFFVLENPLCKYTEYLYPFHKIKNGSFLNGSFEMDQLLFNSSLLNSYLNMNFNKNWEKLINRYHLPGFCNSRFSLAIVPLSESVKNEH